eukprot:CAMPEP_0174276964 /NCGR_PEP_ID=MMETSP0439-20130205/60673_1 /TAXON_ID=0 /ORGANISM="Stereomyxa ramosa, Strain Chinc5" /LENGTH=100 /DNA_ID=CAMNT_0015369241 /DNA_START=792 /DNA_END=1094 /DNA_ORIENTATION=-
MRGEVPEPKFEYRVSRVSNTEYKTTTQEKYMVSLKEHRLVRKRHGILITFENAARVGSFSFYKLLFHLVSGLALLRVASMAILFIGKLTAKKSPRPQKED